MAYVISVHIPIALTSLLPVLLQWKEMVLFPVHIVFLELIIDPACSIVFEAEPAEADVMRRKPRGPGERLFGRMSLLISCLQGLVSFAAVMGVYSAALAIGQSTAEARTLAFITLIVSNLCLILTNRNWSRSAVSAFSAGQSSPSLGVGRSARIPGAGGLRSRPARLVPLCPDARPGHCHSARRRAREHRLVRDGEGSLEKEAQPKSVSWLLTRAGGETSSLQPGGISARNGLGRHWRSVPCTVRRAQCVIWRVSRARVMAT